MIPIDSKEYRDLVRIVSHLYQRVQDLEGARVYQQNIVPGAVKNRHIDGVIIESGLAADRPDGTTHTKAYYNTDSNVLSIWDNVSETWIDFYENSNVAVIPDTPATYTPTNVTTDRAYDADTVLVAELADVVGTLIADLQAIGLID